MFASPKVVKKFLTVFLAIFIVLLFTMRPIITWI